MAREVRAGSTGAGVSAGTRYDTEGEVVDRSTVKGAPNAAARPAGRDDDSERGPGGRAIASGSGRDRRTAGFEATDGVVSDASALAARASARAAKKARGVALTLEASGAEALKTGPVDGEV